MHSYLCLCRRGRQIDSSRSGPVVTAKPLWWMAEAAGWTGPLLQWGSWVSPSWCAGPHRMMSACSPSACHKGQRWRRLLLNTENRLMRGGRKSGERGIEDGRIKTRQGKKEGSWREGRKHCFWDLCNDFTNEQKKSKKRGQSERDSWSLIEFTLWTLGTHAKHFNE